VRDARIGGRAEGARDLVVCRAGMARQLVFLYFALLSTV
jgi:hypothetical protein